MFGYIRTYQPELRIKEHEAYKAVYCGLCREMGKQYGFFARLVLSYDFAFLSILAMDLAQTPPETFFARCVANPLKKCACCRKDGVSDAVAAQAMISLYYKCLDQLSDEGFFSRMPAVFAFPFLKQCWKKARRLQPEYDRWMARLNEEQRKVEADQSGPDAAAEPTAHCLALTCQALSEDETKRRILHRFGYLLGRFVYLCDALDDLEQDAKKGRFNPYLQTSTLPSLKEKAYQPAVDSIRGTAGELARTFELLDWHDWRPVLENIIYFGLEQSLRNILNKKEKKHDGSV